MEIRVKKYLGSAARVLPLISTLMACQFFSNASAGTIVVTQIRPAINGIRFLALRGDAKGKLISVEGVTADGQRVDAGDGFSTLSGTFELTISGPDTTNWQKLKIVGDETWEGITKEGPYESEKQKKKQKAPGSFQDRPNGLPFEFLPNLWTDGDETFAQIDIINTSPVFAYSFTSLKLFKGLSLVYWQTDQFDSPAAIATGTFQWDFVSDNGSASITKAGGDVAPILAFPLGTPSFLSYDLLTGVARPILAPGVYGDPISFSTGFSAVPEPSSRAIVMLVCVAFGFRKRLVSILKSRFVVRILQPLGG